MVEGDVVDAARGVIRSEGAGALVIDDLCGADLARIGWSGTKPEVRAVAEALGRVSSGEVEYLVVRARLGEPVAKAGITYTAHPGAGTVWQVATHPDLQSLGLGTRLMIAAEDRIRRRSLL